MQGAMVGVGKGIVGLVMKPVAGTLDLVTLTARGVANTPTTIYLKVGSLFKKKAKKSHPRVLSPPSSSSKINPHSELSVHLGDTEADVDIELDVDEDELKRQMISEFAKRPSERLYVSPRIDAKEKFPDAVLRELRRIQELHRAIADTIRGRELTLEEFKAKLESRLQARDVLLERADEDTREIKEEPAESVDQMKAMDEEFEGFTTPAAPEEPDNEEDMAGFDETDEFREEDPDISVASESAADDDFADFVTVKSDDDEEEQKRISAPPMFAGLATATPESQRGERPRGTMQPRKTHHAKNPLTQKKRQEAEEEEKRELALAQSQTKAKSQTPSTGKKPESKSELESEPRREPVEELKRHVSPVKKVERYRTAEILAKAQAWGISKFKDEFRQPPADTTGGMPLVDKKVMEVLRSVAKEYLKEIFGRLFSGNFNLTTISFPIKCMRPISLLETFGRGGATNPIYLNKAALHPDPIERIKYTIVAQLSTFYYTSNFLKPVSGLSFTPRLVESDTRRNV